MQAVQFKSANFVTLLSLKFILLEIKQCMGVGLLILQIVSFIVLKYLLIIFLRRVCLI